MKVLETILQQHAVGACERSHVCHSSNAKQITCRPDRLRSVHLSGELTSEHVGQSHSCKARIRRLLGRGGWMNQCQGLRACCGQGVVISEDHFNAEFFGLGQRLMGCHTVVNRDKEPHTCCVQLLHHPRIQAIAIGHATGDCGLGSGAHRREGPHQQRRAGHAIGVVITANGDRFMAITSCFQTLERCLQFRKVVMRWWKRLVTQQRVQTFAGLKSSSEQNSFQGWRQIHRMQRVSLDRRGKLPLLFPLASQSDCDRSMAAL